MRHFYCTTSSITPFLFEDKRQICEPYNTIIVQTSKYRQVILIVGLKFCENLILLF